MQIMLEKVDISVNLEEADKELDLCLWDHRRESDGATGVRGFQTMLTKKDAKAILRALDTWVSVGKLE